MHVSQAAGMTAASTGVQGRQRSAAIPRPVNAKYLGKSIRVGQRDAHVHLNRMLTEQDFGQNICSSRQTLGQYLDQWLDICARPRLRAKSFRDYLTLLAL